MPKKGSKGSRTGRSKAVSAAAKRSARASPGPRPRGLYLQSLDDGSSCGERLEAAWRREQGLMENDLGSIGIVARSNISPEAKTQLRIWRGKAMGELRAAKLLMYAMGAQLGEFCISLDFARQAYNRASVEPRVAPKRGRSQKATAPTAKSQQ